MKLPEVVAGVVFPKVNPVLADEVDEKVDVDWFWLFCSPPKSGVATVDWPNAGASGFGALKVKVLPVLVCVALL